jgi:hypothetical protein
MEIMEGAVQEVCGMVCKSLNRPAKQIRLSSKIYYEITKFVTGKILPTGNEMERAKI